MTHDEIADFCADRLKGRGYPLAFSNCTSAIHGEQPDVLGLNAYGRSIVVEVKVSRSDFFADKKKPWRKDGCGMGDTRVYLTPKDLLSPCEIPFGWELWEVHGEKRKVIKVIKGQKKVTKKDSRGLVPWSITAYEYPNMEDGEFNHFKRHGKDKNYREELTWMIKIMRRAQIVTGKLIL